VTIYATRSLHWTTVADDCAFEEARAPTATMTVTEAESPRLIETGLLDASGERIYRVREVARMGFVG
jgi:hypothetical protein